MKKKGILNLDTRCEDEYGRTFRRLDPGQMDTMLKKFEAEGERVFMICKELTLIGYFTSEEGMKSNFEYRPIPGKYDDCVDYSPGDKVWIGNHVFNV